MSNFLTETHLRKLANTSERRNFVSLSLPVINPALSLPAGAIVSVSSEETLRSAFEKLQGAGVYSVPVYQADSNKYLGLLSLHSIVSRLISLFASRCGGMANVGTHSWTAKDVADVQYEFNALKIEPDLIQHVEGKQSGINAQDAINFFVHSGNDRSSIRLPILAEDNSIANIVSPTMLLRLLHQHMADLPASLVSKSISGFPGVVSPNVQTVRSSESALASFAKMQLLQYSALGIEDPENPAHRHIGSIITIKDIGHALKDFSRLLKPVEDYVNVTNN